MQQRNANTTENAIFATLFLMFFDIIARVATVTVEHVSKYHSHGDESSTFVPHRFASRARHTTTMMTKKAMEMKIRNVE